MTLDFRHNDNSQPAIGDPRRDNVLPLHARPRLGFAGTGWIGRLRMQALLKANIGDCCFAYDPSATAVEAAAQLDDCIATCRSFEELLSADIDGIVIATPNAFHLRQTLAALSHGKAVFCQKPLARTRDETAMLIDAARGANKLLGVDFCYRHLAGLARAKELIDSGELGEVYAAELVFHNAYGPDKDWFYDVKAAGGGCVMDLGIHLVDLAMWLFGSTEARNVGSCLYRNGQRLQAPFATIEDYAAAHFDLGDAHCRLLCSWKLNAGYDAVIQAKLYGTRGGITLSNVNGSFFDFEVFHCLGTSRHQLASYPDDWGGRALCAWVEQLRRSSAYDPRIERAYAVADVIDRIYHR